MADNNTIEALTLEVNATSESAEKAVDKLISTLERLHNKTANLGLGNIGTQLKGIQKAASGFGEREAEGLNRVFSALERLQNVSDIKISSSIANQLSKIGVAAGNLNGVDFSGIDRLCDALDKLSGVGEVNISSALNQLNRIPKIAEGLKEIDLEDFAKRIREITEALKPLAEEMEKVSKGFSAFPDKIQKLLRETDKIPDSNKKAADSYDNLEKAIKKAVVVLYSIEKAINAAMKMVELANDQVETANLFNVAMGQYAEKAGEYANAVGSAMGLSPTDWMENQGVLMTLATGFGVAGDRAADMSQNLTQLGYDLASFYNISTEDAFQKIQSGLAGEIEPMRRLGYDLSNAALQQIAVSKGITKTVSDMNQAEKSMLRYYAMMTQVTQVHGDLARTIDSPANQLRRLKTAVTEAARSLGNLLIPLLNTLIPILINAANAVKNFADTLIRLLGIETISGTQDFANVVSGASDAFEALDGASGDAGENVASTGDALDKASDAAKEFQKTLLGIDELNVLNKPGSGLGALEDILEELENMEDIEAALDFGDIGNIWDGLVDEDFAIPEIDSPLALTIKDVFFDWGNLTGEDILQKLLVGFGAVIGAVAGFVLGGFKGGVLGLALGTALTLLLSSVIFDHDGQLSQDEIFQTLIPILTSTLGVVLTGSPVGGVIGLAVGAALSLLLEEIVFKDGGELNGAEIIQTLLPIIGGIAGLVITGGNPVGGVVGLGIGAALSLLIEKFGVESETGDFSKEIWDGTKDIIARAFAGAGIGFIVTGGNPGGALIGAAIGVMVTLALNALGWNALGWNGEASENVDIIKGLLKIISAAGAGILAATIGGASGIGFGLAVTAGLSFLIDKVDWGGLGEKVSGITDWISQKFSGMSKDIVDSFSGAKSDVDLKYMEPTEKGFSNLFTWLKGRLNNNADQIVASFSGAKSDVDLAYMKPTQEGFSNLFTSLKQNFASLRENIAADFADAGSRVMNNFIYPLGTQANQLASKITSWFGNTRDNIINAFKTAADRVVEIFRSFADWFNRNIITPISEKLGGISSKISQVTGGSNLTTSSSAYGTYATGGLPAVGEMFIARERGPELVGRIGNQSAVVNNNQIIAGIKQGVYEAMMASNGGEQNINVYLSGKQVMTTVAEEARRETIRTGINPLTQGG